MKKLTYIFILISIVCCKTDTSETIVISKKVEMSIYDPGLITNFLIHKFKNQIIDSLKSPFNIRVNLVDACDKISLDSLDIPPSKKNINHLSEFYSKIRKLERNSSFILDNKLNILKINSINDSIETIDFKITFLNINDTSSIVLVTYLINPEFGDGTLYYLGINSQKDVYIKRSKLLWSN